MRVIYPLLSLTLTVLLCWFLSVGHSIKGKNIPPVGHFLNPFEGFWQNANGRDLSLISEINLDGLQSSVSIDYDSMLVPHISASNDRDLYMAQGYVVANLRLWQMEFQTHAAAGRLSEIIGRNEKIITFDRLQRRTGMIFGAKATLGYMEGNSDLAPLIEAYTDGVNFYISSLSYKDFPLEYKLLNYTPEPWTSFKTALTLQYMISDLSGYDDDLENTHARNLFGIEVFDLLFPDYPKGIEPTIPTNPDSLWSFNPIPPTPISAEDLARYTSGEKPDPDNGSNNWVVSGSKTKSGYPILANDTHLGLNFPSLWMMIQLRSPTANVCGFSLAGALGVVIGHNDSTAWGYTNAPRDTRDWYRTTFRNNHRNEYLYDNRWRSATHKVEQINIKGDDPYYDTVVYTHHGPIVYDDRFLNADRKLQDYSLKWSGHNASRVPYALLLLNRASDYEEHLTAIKYWDSPAQNIAFGSTQGDIAMAVEGVFPAKWKAQGKFLMDGADRAHEWGNTIPKAHNARAFNPEKGFTGSANQHSVDSLYPYYYYNSKIEYYRNRRINELLVRKNNITVQDMGKMQTDSYSLKAAEILPILLDSLNTSALTSEQIDYVEKLKRWNYVYSAGKLTPLIFNTWWLNIYKNIWDEFDTLTMTRPSHYNTYLLMRDHPSLSFFDVQSTSKKETLTDLINLSFDQATKTLNKWLAQNPDYNWGDYKATRILHLLKTEELSIFNIAIDGQTDAINATKSEHGPSQRFVVEMTRPPEAYGIYPGGQSGNPGSYYYDNMVEQWRTGKLIPLLFMQPDQNYDHKIMISQILKPSVK